MGYVGVSMVVPCADPHSLRQPIQQCRDPVQKHIRAVLVHLIDKAGFDLLGKRH